MTKNDTSVVVTSRSFSRNEVLRSELLELYSNVIFNDEGHALSGASLVDFLQGHSKAITALERIDSTLIAQLPELKVLSKYGVGIDMIDLLALKAAGVRFGWTKGVNRRSVSELTLSFMISLLRSVPDAQNDVMAGKWRQWVGSTLTGKTVGIIGCGNVGKDLVRLLQPFGCQILIHDITAMPDFAGAFDCVETDLMDLVSCSDVVTVHTPLDDTTRNLLGKDEFSKIKLGAVLVNAARGGIVDETALLDSLKNGRLAGAALDVLTQEPPESDVFMALIAHPSVIVTPHIGGSANEAILAMGRAAIRGLDEHE